MSSLTILHDLDLQLKGWFLLFVHVFFKQSKRKYVLEYFKFNLQWDVITLYPNDRAVHVALYRGHRQSSHDSHRFGSTHFVTTLIEPVLFPDIVQ